MRKLAALVLGAAALWLTIPSIGAQQPDRQDVLILFRRSPNQDDTAEVTRAGGRIKRAYRLVPAIAANLPSQAIQGLSRNPNIEIIEPDFIAQAIADPDFAAELNNVWGVKKIGAGDAHNLTPSEQGQGINVAIIDTGINYSHPDLALNYRGGVDFVNDDNNPMDDNGHGTHVAGTVGAVRNGVGAVGVAPLVNLYAVKVLAANGSGFYSDIIAGVQWATENNMQVTNNSYSGSSGSATLELAFQNAAAAGVVSVAAAGNSGTQAGNGDNMGYPAKYNSVISVGATNDADGRASFSSTGPRLELAAPGVNIYSTVMSGGYQAGWNGTSMACPHVAGAAALLFGKTPVDSNVNGKANDEIRNVLALTALDLGAAGRDSRYGFGRIRVMEALNADPVPPSSTSTGVSYSSPPGRNRDLTIAVSAIYKPVVPAAGVTVHVSVNLNGGFYASGSGITNAAGVATIVLPKAPTGIYTTTVTNITGGGLAFDFAPTPSNSFNKK